VSFRIVLSLHHDDVFATKSSFDHSILSYCERCLPLVSHQENTKVVQKCQTDLGFGQSPEYLLDDHCLHWVLENQPLQRSRCFGLHALSGQLFQCHFRIGDFGKPIFRHQILHCSQSSWSTNHPWWTLEKKDIHICFFAPRLPIKFYGLWNRTEWIHITNHKCMLVCPKLPDLQHNFVDSGNIRKRSHFVLRYLDDQVFA